MSKTLCIANNKGGVGKTTTAVNLAAALALKGHSVLLVDIDAQCSLTVSLNVSTVGGTIFEALTETQTVVPVNVASNIDAVPASRNLGALALNLGSEPGSEYLLKEYLSSFASKYDYIIIDTPPAEFFLIRLALTAADNVLVPMKAQPLSLQGLADLEAIVEKVQKRLNPKLAISAVFMIEYESRPVLSRQVLETVKKKFGAAVCDTYTTRCVALAEATAMKLDIFRYDPESKGAAQYLALADDILKRI